MRVARFVVPLLILIVWIYACEVHIASEYLLPTPQNVLETFIKDILNFSLIHNTVISLSRLTLGILLGFSFGFLFAIATSTNEMLEEIFLPIFTSLSNLPVTALIPLIILFFGIEETGKYTVIAICSFFPVYFSTLNGVKTNLKKFSDLLTIYPKNFWFKIFTFTLPAGKLWSIHGLKNAFINSWGLIIIAEVIGSEQGLGWLLWDARNFGRTAEVYVVLISIGIIGFIIQTVFNKIENKYESKY